MKFDTSPKILVVGDIILDRFIWGTSDRISPEAPVPIVRFSSDKCMLGGAGNVARNLKTLGAEVELLGLLGTDMSGDLIHDLLIEQDIGCTGLIGSTNYQTIVKTRIISGSQHIVRLDKEGPQIPDEDTELLRTKSEELSRWADLILIADYGKGVVRRPLVRLLTTSGKKVIVDPTLNADFSRYDSAWMIKPNLKEAKNAIQHISNRETISPHKIAQEILKKYAINRVLITLSGDGMIYSELGSLYWEKPFISKHDYKEVRDVSGAGDTVLAVLGFCLAHTPSSIQTAIDYANKAGSIVVGKLGTASVTQNELFK